MDGNGSLFGTLSGNTREVLHKFTVDLPKKHGRGGQSALRFARLRMEKRHNYVRKVSGKPGMQNIFGHIVFSICTAKQDTGLVPLCSCAPWCRDCGLVGGAEVCLALLCFCWDLRYW